MQVCEKVEKSRFIEFFQWFVVPESRKVGSLKRRVRSYLARWEKKNWTSLRCEAHFEVNILKKATCSDHFCTLRCWKSARSCGAKYVSKSKSENHTRFGALLELEMLKKYRPLWREAHFEVKMPKTPHALTTFGRWDDEKVHAAVARSTFRSQNVKSTRRSDHFWTFHRATAHNNDNHNDNNHHNNHNNNQQQQLLQLLLLLLLQLQQQ